MSDRIARLAGRAYSKTDFVFYICFVFLACAFLGWIFEAGGAAILKHKFTEKGYLFVLQPLPYYFPALQNVPLLRAVPLIVGLPLIEIYGFGGLITIFGLGRLKDKPVLLFLAGMVVLTLFELAGSYFCSEVLHKTFWDYSGKPFNFQGRICLLSALMWGVGGVFFVKIIAPLLQKQFAKWHDRGWFRPAVVLLILGALVCALAKYCWFPDILAKSVQ